MTIISTPCAHLFLKNKESNHSLHAHCINNKTKLKLHAQTDLYWVNALLYDDSVGSLKVDSFSAAFTKS